MQATFRTVIVHGMDPRTEGRRIEGPRELSVAEALMTGALDRTTIDQVHLRHEIMALAGVTAPTEAYHLRQEKDGILFHTPLDTHLATVTAGLHVMTVGLHVNCLATSTYRVITILTLRRGPVTTDAPIPAN